MHNRDPLLPQIFNPPSAFSPHLSKLSQTPIPPLRDLILGDLSLEKFRQIHTTIGPHSPKLLQVSMVTVRVPSLACDVVLTAPAADQARFLAWRRGVFGWGGKCLCGDRFDREHTTCMPYSDPGLTEDQLFIYEIDRYLIDSNTKYTIMDYLLNHRLWNQARTILDSSTHSMSTHLRTNASHI